MKVHGLLMQVSKTVNAALRPYEEVLFGDHCVVKTLRLACTTKKCKSNKGVPRPLQSIYYACTHTYRDLLWCCTMILNVLIPMGNYTRGGYYGFKMNKRRSKDIMRDYVSFAKSNQNPRGVIKIKFKTPANSSLLKLISSDGVVKAYS
jgi:hypothetical protein